MTLFPPNTAGRIPLSGRAELAVADLTMVAAANLADPDAETVLGTDDLEAVADRWHDHRRGSDDFDVLLDLLLARQDDAVGTALDER